MWKRFTILAGVVVALTACGTAGPDPNLDVTGIMWMEEGGNSTLEFTDSGDFMVIFDPKLSDGTSEYGATYRRVDNAHLTFTMLGGKRASMELTTVEVTIVSNDELRFKLDGKTFRFTALQNDHGDVQPFLRQANLYYDHGDVQALLRQGANLHYDAGRWARAVLFYQRALELKPDDPDMLTDMGACYRGLREFDKALELFAQAEQIDPSHWQSLYNTLVVQAFDLGRNEEALETLRRLERVKPDTPNLARLRDAVQDRLAGGESGGGPNPNLDSTRKVEGGGRQ